MSDMADVLAGHQDATDANTPYLCSCGWSSWSTQLSAHQAAALTTAGFGPVQAARAEAWDEGAQAEADTTMLTEEEESAGVHAATFVCPSRNPYRTEASS
jgi:hypothetical protein